VVKEKTFVPAVSRRGKRTLVLRSVSPTSDVPVTPSPSPHKSRQYAEGSGSPSKRPWTFSPPTLHYDVPELIGRTTKVPHFLFYKNIPVLHLQS
jgi:hypothetical protein